MFVRAKKRGNRTYLMIVKNERVNGRVRQTVLHSLGRLDLLQQSGELDALLVSAQRFSEESAVLNAHAQGESITAKSHAIGPSLVFEKLWKKLGVDVCLDELLEDRKFEFDVARAIFLTVLHRLFESGSDRQAIRWKEDQCVEGAEALQLHHFYRAMAWLGEELPEEEQAGATPFAPRCVKPIFYSCEAFFVVSRLFSMRHRAEGRICGATDCFSCQILPLIVRANCGIVMVATRGGRHVSESQGQRKVSLSPNRREPPGRRAA